MTEVLVEPDDTAERLRDYVRNNPDVRHDDYETDDIDPIREACYVLSEAYFHAQGGKDAGYNVYRIGWDDVYDDGVGAHWFLRDSDGRVIDLSLPTPEYGQNVPWDAGRHRAFITGYEPSKRTKQALDALGIDHS